MEGEALVPSRRVALENLIAHLRRMVCNRDFYERVRHSGLVKRFKIPSFDDSDLAQVLFSCHASILQHFSSAPVTFNFYDSKTDKPKCIP